MSNQNPSTTDFGGWLCTGLGLGHDALPQVDNPTHLVGEELIVQGDLETAIVQPKGLLVTIAGTSCLVPVHVDDYIDFLNQDVGFCSWLHDHLISQIYPDPVGL